MMEWLDRAEYLYPPNTKNRQAMDLTIWKNNGGNLQMVETDIPGGKKPGEKSLGQECMSVLGGGVTDM